MGQTAENLAYRFGISRREMDEFSARSHRRTLAAQKEGRFGGEIVSLYDRSGAVYPADDGVREDSTPENLAKLRPFFRSQFGNVTAGNSSQITDGAAWLVLASAATVRERKLPVLGRIVDSEWAGLDPAQMGLGPVHAATPILRRNGLSLDDIDAWEINEAFAGPGNRLPAPLGRRRVLQGIARARPRAWRARHRQAQCRRRRDRHRATRSAPRAPASCCTCSTSCAGAGAQRGLASICIGGGQGGAMLVERVEGVPA